MVLIVLQGSNAVLGMSGGSLVKALIEAYPTVSWDKYKFVRRPGKY